MLQTIARCSLDKLEGFVKLVTGKFLDEVDIPISEDEQEYLSDMEEE